MRCISNNNNNNNNGLLTDPMGGSSLLELPCARTKRHPTTAYTAAFQFFSYQLCCASVCVLKKLYTVPLKSKALFTRREGDPAARVTLARGLYPSTNTFLLFLHDMFTRQVGLP